MMELRFIPELAWQDVVESMSILAFAIFVNVCSTMGWISETARVKDKTCGPKMYKVGLFMTMGFTLVPMVLDILLN